MTSNRVGFVCGIRQQLCRIRAQRSGTRDAFERIEARCAMVRGLITSKDVLLRSTVIVREFGLWTWLRCCLVLFSRRRITFLELVFAR
jgi:hypothetical protein